MPLNSNARWDRERNDTGNVSQARGVIAMYAKNRAAGEVVLERGTYQCVCCGPSGLAALTQTHTSIGLQALELLAQRSKSVKFFDEGRNFTRCPNCEELLPPETDLTGWDLVESAALPNIEKVGGNTYLCRMIGRVPPHIWGSITAVGLLAATCLIILSGFYEDHGTYVWDTKDTLETIGALMAVPTTVGIMFFVVSIIYRTSKQNKPYRVVSWKQHQDDAIEFLVEYPNSCPV